MKKVSPGVAAGAITVLIVLIGVIAWKFLGETSHAGEKPPGMPPAIAQQMGQAMQHAPAAARAASVHH